MRPTGCPTCGTGGIPGTACAACVRQAHEVAVRHSAKARGRMFVVEADADVHAAWVGANLLLDELGLLLMKVGFELPDVGARRPWPAAQLDDLLRHAAVHGEAVLYTPPSDGEGVAVELVPHGPQLDRRMGCVERELPRRRAGT